MRSKRVATLGIICAATMLLAACGSDDNSSSNSSSGSSSGSGGSASSGDPIKVGALTSLSGPGTAGFTGFIPGVKARLEAYKADKGECAGRDITVVEADDTSNPQGALAAAQKMVQQEKVYALLNASSFFTGASQYMATQGATTPVVGGGFDSAAQWSDPNVKNMFPAPPVADYTNVYSTTGQYLKDVGVTKFAVVSYATKSAASSAQASLVSAEAAGIEKGYTNLSVPFGSTDVGAIVLGIQESKSDGIQLVMTPDTGFAIAAGLRQANYTPKSLIIATGYGADLLESPPAVAAGQGVTFSTSFTPVELETEATKTFSDALVKYAGSKSGIPSFSQAQGWMAADLLIHGLEAAGCDATQEEFISTLRKDKSWDADGLLPAPLDYTKPGGGPSPCIFMSTLQGNEFVPDPKAAPACGEPLGKGI